MIHSPKASFVFQTDYEGQAKKLLELMENTDVIVVAGGDGTLQEVWPPSSSPKPRGGGGGAGSRPWSRGIQWASFKERILPHPGSRTVSQTSTALHFSQVPLFQSLINLETTGNKLVVGTISFSWCEDRQSWESQCQLRGMSLRQQTEFPLTEAPVHSHFISVARSVASTF